MMIKSLHSEYNCDLKRVTGCINYEIEIRQIYIRLIGKKNNNVLAIFTLYSIITPFETKKVLKVCGN